ncbi:BlaI/MecI/CopY family transcriptional regulator [Fulvivirga sp. RKSG066]|uniref:BlaI/MecI/CopY family transcriptional regulator n=1 Tax=Fulvivirga aurantia TaxID=2529383 RepID=UPI0012BD0CD3|nr:BlaI/MecI/CopY family transcriptional regulator [Fulvivirga aurantia]MTI22648.1 BlaI/MecI/CopY family transcriptional regulator [Fulvivirga aurantia]
MKELTKAEEQIMQVLWRLKKGFLKDIVDAMPNPKPAYPTVSTVVRVLVKKGFIAHNTYGKVNEYYPAVEKNAYFRHQFKGMVSKFFGNSWQGFASFFASANLSTEELESLKEEIDKQIEQRKKND